MAFGTRIDTEVSCTGGEFDETGEWKSTGNDDDESSRKTANEQNRNLELLSGVGICADFVSFLRP